MARASAKVVGSAAVGPEAMTSSGSPMTSEMIRLYRALPANAWASRPPLKALKMLADGVHLVDGGAAGVQLPGDGLLVGQRQAGGRRGQEGRAAAGKKTQGHVVRASCPGQPQNLLGAGHALGRRVIAAGRAGSVQTESAAEGEGGGEGEPTPPVR